MSAVAEMWHIMKKDLQQSRWLFAAYVGLVLAATIGAVSGEELAGGGLQWAAVLLLILGPIIAASLVQADSPTRADAFWASQPFRRSVMLGAKVTMVAGILLLLPLIGQLIGLRAFDVPPNELWRTLLISALIYGFVLLISMFLAALTRDLREFVLSVVGLAAGMVLTVIAVTVWDWSLGGPALEKIVAGAGLLAVLVLLVLLYLRRDLPSARACGVAALAMILLGNMSSNESARSPGFDETATAGRPGGARIMAELRDTAQISQAGRMLLYVNVTGARGPQHFRLRNPQGRFFLHNGAHIDVPLWELTSSVLRAGPMTLPGIPSLQDDNSRLLDSTTQVLRTLSADQRRALMKGIDSVQVTSELDTYDPHVLATLPPRVGAGVLRDGEIVRVDTVSLGSFDKVLTLHFLGIGGDKKSSDWMDMTGGLNAFLVNEQRGEGVELPRKGASYDPGLLVLPGAGVHQGEATYSAPRQRNGDLYLADPAWQKGAKLMLIGWTQTRSDHVRASSVPLPPRENSPRRRVGPSMIIMPREP